MMPHARNFGGALRPDHPRSRRSTWIGAAIAVGAVITAGIWFVFVSGYWRISRIEAYGIDEAGRGEVESIVYKILDEGPWKPWDKRNIFFVETAPLAIHVQEVLFAESVAVEKSYPNILRLMITERQRSVILVSKGQQLVVDTQGVVTGETDERSGAYVTSLMARKVLADPTRLPVVVSDLDEQAGSGYQASDENHVKRWIKAYRALLDGRVKFRFMGLERLDSSLARLKAEDGTDILMDLELPLEPQIETYNKFMQNKKKEVVIQEYVDVRVAGKIFVK